MNGEFGRKPSAAVAADQIVNPVIIRLLADLPDQRGLVPMPVGEGCRLRHLHEHHGRGRAEHDKLRLKKLVWHVQSQPKDGF